MSLFFHVFFPHEIFTSQGRERVKKRNAPVRVVDGPALGPVFDTGHQGPEPSPVERRVGLEQPVDEKIRIPPYGRGEVGVALAGKSEMPHVPGRILSLLETPQEKH